MDGKTKLMIAKSIIIQAQFYLIMASVYNLPQLIMCLHLWKTVKFTRIGLLIQSIIVCLLLSLSTPKGLVFFPTAASLQHFKGRLFKRVRCHVIHASDPMALPCGLNHQLYKIRVHYLGNDFVLERKEGNRLFVDGEMSYYITDAISASLLEMVRKAPSTVFLSPGYMKFSERTVVSSIMTFKDVLDSLILKNHIIHALENDYLLPVNVSGTSRVSVPLIVNLVSLSLELYDLYWRISFVLGQIGTVCEFIEEARIMCNEIVCCAMHFVCDRLPYPMRRRVYVFGCWVENLKPSNDIELRVVRGHKISAVIAGGAKASKEDATLVPDGYEFSGQADEEGAALVPYGHRFVAGEGYVEIENTFKCAEYIDIKCKRRFVYVEDAALAPEYEFLSNEASAEVVCAHRRRRQIVEGYVEASTRDGVAMFKLDIEFKTSDEFMKMSTFLSCVSTHLSGSLECQGSRNRLRVRPLRESIMCYVRNGYPPVYTLELQNVEVL